MADALERWANPELAARRGPRGARGARGGAATRSPRRSAGVMTSSSPPARARRSRSRCARAKARAAVRLGATEHDAVVARDAAGRAVGCRSDADGLIVDRARRRLAGDRPLVADPAGQQRDRRDPAARPTSPARSAQRAALLLADCAQSAGKLPLPDADFIAISAHKLGGPPGIGALLVRDLGDARSRSAGRSRAIAAAPRICPAIVGIAAALEARRAWLERCRVRFARRLEAAIVAAGGEVIAARRAAARHDRRLSHAGRRQRDAQLIQFDLAGIAVSAGSACSSGSLKASHVLAAMGWAEPTARRGRSGSASGRPRPRREVDASSREWRRIAERGAAAA